MTWNYRVVEHASGSLMLCEVYYDEEGNPSMRTEPLLACDADEGLQGIIGSLEMALNDVRTKPVLPDWVKEHDDE